MTVATRTANREYIALGMAELYLADSVTNLSSFDSILTNTDYVGAKTEVAFEISKELKNLYKTVNNIKVLFDQLVTNITLTLSIRFIELTKRNVSYSFGGDNTETNLLQDLLAQPKEHRAELLFTYPNRINTMTFILPRVMIANDSIDGKFDSSDAIGLPMKINALITENAAWSTAPIGRLLFG